MKQCFKCGKVKKRQEYYVKKNTCKSCHSEKMRASYHKNKKNPYKIVSIEMLHKLLNNIQVIISSGCWEWVRCLDRKGYGVIYCGYKSMRAHRVSYRLFKGEIYGKSLICHRCDNRRCVNPEHLDQGTPLSNMRDKFERNRFVKRNHANKFRQVKYEIKIR